MPNEIFGTPGGTSAAIQDQLSMAQLAMAPDVARATKAKADISELQAKGQKIFSESLQRNPNQGMWGMARAAMEAGLPDAYKYANVASLADYRASQERVASARTAELTSKAIVADADLRGRSLTGVTNRQGLQAAFQDYERQTGRRSGYLDAQGNLNPQITDADVPTIVGRERARAISAKDQALFDFRNKSLASAEKERASKQAAREFWQDTDNQYKREAARQRARTDAHGGSAGLFPTNAQITIGAEYLSNKFNVDPKDPWSRVMGRELIDNAKRIKALNSSMSAKEALDQAFQEMDKKPGTFGGHRLADKKADLYRPMTLPYDADGKPDKSKLKAGQLYTDDSGAVREWTGAGWSTPTQKITQDEDISDDEARRALTNIGDDADFEDDDEED